MSPATTYLGTYLYECSVTMLDIKVEWTHVKRSRMWFTYHPLGKQPLSIVFLLVLRTANWYTYIDD